MSAADQQPPTRFELDIILSAAGARNTYQAEARDAGGALLGCHTFHYRTDLLATYQQLKTLEAGAVLATEDATVSAALAGEAQRFGHELFTRIFDGEVGQAWHNVCATAEAAGKSVRLRLRSGAPALDALPWEFLHDGEAFLAPERRVLLAHGSADLPDLAAAPPTGGALAILVIVSHPLDLAEHQSFEPDEELGVIYAALDEPLRRSQVQIDVVDEASPSEIQRALIARDYQVVHFIGHGGFDEQQGGHLLLEDDAGDSARLSAKDFAGLLGGRGVRLVLLSSCLTARSTPTQAYRSVAGALLRQGIPAVVAMQYPILVTSARTFYRVVYTSLAANRALDAAVAEGRQALYLDRRGASLDWATPALFTRRAGGWQLGIDPQSGVTQQPERDTIVFGELESVESGFVGRQREQRTIRRELTRGHARAALIHGFGGIGKTVLATRVARRLVDGGAFEGVAAVKVRPGLGADDVLRAVNDSLTRLGIDAFDAVLRSPALLAQKVDALAQLLRQVRLLLIFDNAEDWLQTVDGRHTVADADVATLLARLVGALDRSSRLLITSRYVFDIVPPGRLGGAVAAVPLGELSQGEAARLMGSLPALRTIDYTTRLRVYLAVGGHPFVLNLFAERAARDGVEYVLADVRTVRREADVMGRFLLGKIIDGLSEEARRLLTHASVMRRALPRPALEALFGTHRIGEVLEELLGWGLIVRATFDDELCDNPEVRFGQHALVREEMGPRLAQSDKQAAILTLANFYVSDEHLQSLSYGSVRVFNRLEARYYFFEASAFLDAGEQDSIVAPHLVRWGLLDTARELNSQTAEYASGRVQAAALQHWAIVEQEQGNYDRAQRLYERSLKLSEELGDKAGVAKSLGQLSVLQREQCNYIEAQSLCERSLRLAEELDDKVDVAAGLHQLGNLQFLQGNYGEAQRLYERSLKLSEELGYNVGVAISLSQLGNLQFLQGNYSEAQALYERCLRLSGELGDKSGVASSLHSLGMLQQAWGNYGEAQGLYERTVKTMEELDNKSGVATSLHQLGTLQFLQGNYGEAQHLYERSLKAREELGDKAGVASSLHQLGMLQQAWGNYDKAQGLYEHSLRLAEELGSKASVATSLHQLGILQQSQGNYADAQQLYERSLKLAEDLVDKAGVAASLHQLGILQQVQGNFDDALQLYERSLTIKDALGDKAGAAKSLGQLGTLAQMQGQLQPACGYYLRALAIFETLRTPLAQLVRRHLAGIRGEVSAATFAAWWQDAVCTYALDLGVLQPEDIESEREANLNAADQQMRSLEALASAVVAALRTEDEEARRTLDDQLAQLGDRIPLQESGFHWLLAVLQGMLRGKDVGSMAEELTGVWRQVYDGVVAAVAGDDEDQTHIYSINELVAQIANAAIQAAADGTLPKRAELWQQLGRLREQLVDRVDWVGLLAYVDAVRRLLEGKTASAPQDEPFAGAWAHIQAAMLER